MDVREAVLCFLSPLGRNEDRSDAWLSRQLEARHGGGRTLFTRRIRYGAKRGIASFHTVLMATFERLAAALEACCSFSSTISAFCHRQSHFVIFCRLMGPAVALNSISQNAPRLTNGE